MRRIPLFLTAFLVSATAVFGQSLVTSPLRFETTAARDGSLTNIVAASNLQKLKDVTWTASRYFFIDADGALQLTTSSTLALALSSAIQPTWANIQTKPTTLAGFGITDAATAAQGALADSALQLQFISAPSTATSAGIQGTSIQAGNYIYICVATNTWRRIELLTW